MGQKYMKKFFISILLCLTAISAMAQKKDGYGLVINGNHNFLLTIYGGAQYFGDFSKITGSDIIPVAGGELVYNYYQFRASIGGAWGNNDTSYGQVGVYWNFINNANFRNRAYIGVTGGLIQYAAIMDIESLLQGTSEYIDITNTKNISIKLPPNSVAPIVGCRLGVDWMLSSRIYLTTDIEGTHNFVNKRVNFDSIEMSKETDGMNINLELKPSDAPIPVTRWGARVLVGLSFRLK